MIRLHSLLCVTIVIRFKDIPRSLPATDPILPGLVHVRFHDIVVRTLRGEENYAEKILVRARPRHHARRILCVCRLRLALKNGSDALPMERQADAKFVLLFQNVGPCFATKTWVEVYYRLDAISVKLRHNNPVRYSPLNAKSDMLDPDIPKRLPRHPVASAPGIDLTEEEIVTAMKAMVNAKEVGPDGLPVELLELGLQQDRTILLELHQLTALIWREGKVP